MKKFSYFFIFFFSLNSSIAQVCEPNTPTRYRTRNFFPAVAKETFTSSTSSNIDYQFDVYSPANAAGVKEDLKDRPLVVWGHPGGFTQGDRTLDDGVLLCTTLARMGYVCFNYDYRQDLIIESANKVDGGGERAVWKGIQDGRSVVRFGKLYHQYFGIDTNRVYMAGSSAGAFIALNNGFLSNDERPRNTFGGLISPDLKCNDCGDDKKRAERYYTGSLANLNPNTPPNVGFDGELITGNIQAAVSLWGAVGDTNTINNLPQGGVPTLLIHGSSDATVPADTGRPFGISELPLVFGTKPVTLRLLGQGEKAPYFESELLCFEDHELWLKDNDGSRNGDFFDGQAGQHYEFILNRIIDFLWKVQCLQAGTAFPKTNPISPTIPAKAIDYKAICHRATVGCTNGGLNSFAVPAIEGSTFCWQTSFGIIKSGQGTNRITIDFDEQANVHTATVLVKEITASGEVKQASSILVPLEDTQPPTANFTADNAGNRTISFNNTSSTNSLTYSWDFGDGSPLSTLKNPQYQYAQSGSFIVKMTAYNANGCEQTLTKTISVSPTATQDLNHNLQLLSVQPQPMNEQVSVFLKNKTVNTNPYNFQVMDIRGQVILKGRQDYSPDSPLFINTSGLSKGVYVLQVQQGIEKINIKLIK